MRAADLLSERRHRNEPGECKEEQARGLENPGKAPLIARAPRIGVPCLARRADDDHHAQCQERGSEQHPRDQRRSVDAPQVDRRQGDNGSGGEEAVPHDEASGRAWAANVIAIAAHEAVFPITTASPGPSCLARCD